MRKNRLSIALIILAVGAIALYASRIYLPITGIVVDAETGKPIEGAIVLVEWTRTTGIGLTSTKSYKVVEVVTDRAGKFKVPGVYNPFVNAPHLTVYRRDYVAWNNEYIFPDYKKRSDFSWRSEYVFKLNHFKKEYSYKTHVSFIRYCINSSLNLELKKTIYHEFEWERYLAQQER